MEVDDQEWGALVTTDFRAAKMNPRQQALCDYAEKLTLQPAVMAANDLLPLKEQGLSDAGILDLVQVISYFNYINRVADALGVPPESDWSE